MNPFEFSGFTAVQPTHRTPIIRFDSAEDDSQTNAKNTDEQEVIDDSLSSLTEMPGFVGSVHAKYRIRIEGS